MNIKKNPSIKINSRIIGEDYPPIVIWNLNCQKQFQDLDYE